MPSTIYFVTGGCRSGKSSYAQTMCEKLCKNPIYLATSDASLWTDKDFTERIQRHQADRGPEWTTIEEPFLLSKYAEQYKGRAILVDCLTLWLTNYMVKEKAFTPTISKNDADKTETKESSDETSSSDPASDPAHRALEACKEEFEKMTQQWDATFFFITNEIGSGTHATDSFTRKFVDAQGWLNQHVSSKADRVVHMVSGVPNVIKDFAPKAPRRPTIIAVITKAKRDEAIMLDKMMSTRGVKMDEKGYFMLKLEDGLIVASFHSCIVNEKGEVCDLKGVKIKCCSGAKSPDPMKQWKCRTAKELTTELFERWEDAKDIVTAAHAAYIGREVQKAEHCLYAGKHYQQD